LHPRLEKELDLAQPVFVFELDLGLMNHKKIPEYSRLSPFPSVRRDLALLVSSKISYDEISNVLKGLKINELVDSFIFDVYEGENIDLNQKSLALGLIFQEFSRTLQEEEINGHIETIVTTLKDELGVVLR